MCMLYLGAEQVAYSYSQHFVFLCPSMQHIQCLTSTAEPCFNKYECDELQVYYDISSQFCFLCFAPTGVLLL